MTEIDQDLLSILACPSCKGNVVLKDNKIVCEGCGLKYPIRDGIPVMLIDQAEKGERSERSEGKRT